MVIDMKEIGEMIKQYYNDGDIYEGDWRNNNREGKGIYYYTIGDRNEGEFRNDNREGKGIYYYTNDDREIGDYLNGLPKGKFALLNVNGNVSFTILLII